MTEDIHTDYMDRFGRGLCYSLGLFLAHEANLKYVLAEIEAMAAEGSIAFEGRSKENMEERSKILERLAAIRWFSHAANPLHNLEIPVTLPEELGSRLRTLQSKCRDWSFPEKQTDEPSIRDVRWALEEAKELLRLIDALHGITTLKESPAAQAEREPCLVYRDE